MDWMLYDKMAKEIFRDAKSVLIESLNVFNVAQH